MNTERTEKFVNAIACDLEEGGFREVSGTTLRRTLATAVTAALPLLEAGNPVPELAEQQEVREQFEAWARQEPRYWNIARSGNGYYYPITDDAWVVWQAALAATGKQQVGDAQGDALDIAWLKERISSIYSTVSLGHQTGAHAPSRMETLAQPIR